MQLPILGTIPTTIPMDFANGVSSQTEETSKSFVEPTAKETASDNPKEGVYSAPQVTAATQAYLLALQENAAQAPTEPTPNEPTKDAPPESEQRTVNINGLSIITSGHSVDAREGVSLLRTLNPGETKAMMADILAMDDEAETTGAEGVQSENKIIRLDLQGYLMEQEAEALGPLPDGASYPYVNEDFFHSNGEWSTGNPIKKSTSEEAVREDRRVRLETLMNTVDAERQLRTEYGQDVKLIYSHTDNSYIMLTPDDAKYDTMKSAESSVQDVISEVHRGYIEKSTVDDILQRYGYHV